MVATKSVTVQVCAGTVVYHDGTAFMAGESMTLPAADAETLADQGAVVQPAAPRKRGG